MIIYSPLDGEVLTTQIRSKPRCCFLMTQLGDPVPEGVEAIRRSVSDLCENGGCWTTRVWMTGRRTASSSLQRPSEPAGGDSVTNMLRFWLDEQGFGPYLEALRTRRDG